MISRCRPDLRFSRQPLWHDAVGGAYGSGAVFELTPNSDGSWTETVLYSFTGGTDGGTPYAGVIFDPAGNLYGTTYVGGVYGYGTVFMLTPNFGR